MTVARGLGGGGALVGDLARPLEAPAPLVGAHPGPTRAGRLVHGVARALAQPALVARGRVIGGRGLGHVVRRPLAGARIGAAAQE